MSAGGLSYSGLVNYGSITLPSVDSWGTNMSILRDPPKSITTRRINKVGETSSITEMIDASGDRTAESILVYPRGINPMVSVSYNNYGNNGGSLQSGHLAGLNNSFTTLSGATSNAQAFLPYRIMNGQSFRPPIQSPQDLMPLSRQPRVWTSQFTTPGFVDFSKKLRDQGTASETKEVKTETLKTFVRPTTYKKVEKPIEQPNEVKYSIQKVMNLSANSGMRTRDLTKQYVLEPSSGIYNIPLHYNVTANITDNTKFFNNNIFDSSRYIQDANTHTVLSNVSGINETNNNEFDSSRYIQNMHIIDYNAPQSLQSDGTKYIHNDLERSRVIPNHHATTNNADSRIYKNIKHTNNIYLDKNMPNGIFENSGIIIRTEDPNGKSKSIIPKIIPGGYMGNNVGKPLKERIQEIPKLKDNGNSKISKFIANEIKSRY